MIKRLLRILAHIIRGTGYAVLFGCLLGIVGAIVYDTWPIPLFLFGLVIVVAIWMWADSYLKK